jgi:hypothetical protein
MTHLSLRVHYSLDECIQRLLNRHEKPRFLSSRFDRRFDVQFTTPTHFEIRRLQKMFRTRWGNHMAFLEGDIAMFAAHQTQITADATINWRYVLFPTTMLMLMATLFLGLQLWWLAIFVILISVLIFMQLAWVCYNARTDLINLLREVYEQP